MKLAIIAIFTFLDRRQSNFFKTFYWVKLLVSILVIGDFSEVKEIKVTRELLNTLSAPIIKHVISTNY
jgi:hypothetical protein